MPVSRRGLLFRYFDKVLCGIVALGLLLSIWYGVGREAGLSKEVDPGRIARLLAELERKGKQPPPPLEAPDLKRQIAEHFRGVAEPSAARDVMLPPLPVVYSEQTVGPEMRFLLEFNAPLAPGSVRVEGNEYLLGVVEHPVGDDYSNVRLESKSWEGNARVVGLSGDVKHIHPVLVSTEVGKTPYPPVRLAVREQRSKVVLAFSPHPKIKQEEVEVDNYQVWRRDWSNPLGGYKLVGRLAPTPERASGVGRVPEAGAVSPTEEEQLAAIVWEDEDVTAGERYGYKVCTVGRNTYPAKGDFTEPITVEVWSNIDFRFTLPGASSVRFEVRKQVVDDAGPRFVNESFWITRGDEIGGMAQDRVARQMESLLTGYTLLDFHRQATDPKTGARSARVIYCSTDGTLYERYRNQTQSEEFWRQPRPSGRPGRARRRGRGR